MSLPDPYKLFGIDLARQVMREIYRSKDEPPGDFDQDAGVKALPFDPEWAMNVNHDVAFEMREWIEKDPKLARFIDVALDKLDKELEDFKDRWLSEELAIAEIDLRISLLRWRVISKYHPEAFIEA